MVKKNIKYIDPKIIFKKCKKLVKLGRNKYTVI